MTYTYSLLQQSVPLLSYFLQIFWCMGERYRNPRCNGNWNGPDTGRLWPTTLWQSYDIQQREQRSTWGRHWNSAASVDCCNNIFSAALRFRPQIFNTSTTPDAMLITSMQLSDSWDRKYSVVLCAKNYDNNFSCLIRLYVLLRKAVFFSSLLLITVYTVHTTLPLSTLSFRPVLHWRYFQILYKIW